MSTAHPDTQEQQTARDAMTWARLLREAIARGEAPLELAEQALKEHPTEAALLDLAAISALLRENPERSLRFQKRLSKRYLPRSSDHFLRAVALAQQGHWPMALEVLKHHGLDRPRMAGWALMPGLGLDRWAADWVRRIMAENARLQTPAQKPLQKLAQRSVGKSGREARAARTKRTETAIAKTSAPTTALAPAPSVEEDAAPPLVRYPVDIPVRFRLPDLTIPGEQDAGDGAWFRLRQAFAHLGLLQGFDELLCLAHLHQVETYWYQVETVRKVLKQFRGRVLLADEVGLGKTIEAGMVLKEYLLRGMVERVLVLTPASLVGQWHEEMESKFGIPFATSYDPLVRDDPQAFWAQPRVIASIATARRGEHFAQIAAQRYDLVIVDEAHHLKNRATANWKLVDALQKRFLLLLSATPVQNSLVELYNLLTLLKPGIFKTEKEFRAAYMTPGKPRVPANRERMRDLMRDVMVRNTRALVDVRLPPRHALTLRLDPSPEEAESYRALSRLVQEAHRAGPGHHRMALHHLLSAAGSSPAAAATAIHRFAARGTGKTDWRALEERYRALDTGAKEHALVELLERNPTEKKLVFVHHRETLERLDAVLRSRDIAFARFEGSMSGPDKDAAIERFRETAPVLLSTESGGEGRNLQFCNTLVNFDLPWNPMAIEQRIGRLHRIGQHREVFVFNLAVRDTIEDQVLRILDEKINMFELVVGEIGAILGELEEEREFEDMVFSAWVEATEQERASAFAALAERMAEAKREYESVKELDENLFGDEFEAG